MIPIPIVKIEKGYKIHYLEKGSRGRKLVFIHGFLGNSWVFKAQVDYFAKNYHSIAIDHLGHGNSDKPKSESYSFENLAKYLDLTLSKIIGDENIILIGHSMGGMIAQIYASSNLSKRLDGLVLMSTSPRFHNPLMDQYRDPVLQAQEEMYIIEDRVVNLLVNLMFFRKFSKANPEFIKEFTKRTFEIENYVGFRTLREVFSFNSMDKLKSITIPTLIFTSDKDKLILPEDSTILHENIPNSYLKILSPKVGHYIQFEAKKNFHEALQNFLNKI